MAKVDSECAIATCGAAIPRHLLMCLKHWRMVPKRLGQDVYRTWRNGPVAEYLKYREQAIAAVEEKTGVKPRQGKLL
jgi:hypothetical protein